MLNPKRASFKKITENEEARILSDALGCSPKMWASLGRRIPSAGETPALPKKSLMIGDEEDRAALKS
jgi:hypothetical protein